MVAAAPHSERDMAIRSKRTAVRVLVQGHYSGARELASPSFPKTSWREGAIGDLKENENSIIIGKELADDLGLGLGDELRFDESRHLFRRRAGIPAAIQWFTIVAIFSIGLYAYDSQLVYIPFDRAAYLGWRIGRRNKHRSEGA